MAVDINTLYFLDGYSLYKYFGVGVESGSDQLLEFPERKDSISHDWLDEHGLDIDLTRVFLKSREVTFQMWIVADGEADFWNKYNLFLSFLTKPGLRRLTITEHSREYFVYYKKATAYKRFTRIKDTNQVLSKFSLTLIEKDPTQNVVSDFIVDEFTRFIIT
jgi:hypothetical protein